MGYFSEAERRGSLHDPNVSIAEAADTWLAEWGMGTPTKAGPKINERSALNLGTVYSCVRILSEDVAGLPLKLYRDDGDRKSPETANPLYRLMHDQPNPEMDSMRFREALTGHVLTWGNAFAEIERDGRGDPKHLWPITPDRVQVFRKDGEKKYKITVGTDTMVLRQRNVLHIAGLGFDGLVGYSPVRLLRGSIGLGQAAEDFGAYWFGNGSRAGGVLEHPNKLDDAGIKRLRESWERVHRGLDSSHRVAILEEGMTWKQVGIPPDEAQFLQTRKFQVEEIARPFRIPLVLLNHTEKATSWGTGIEQFQLGYLKYTLRAHLNRWENALRQALIPEARWGELYFGHVVEDFLKGDIRARYEAYNAGIRGGHLSPNDVRRKEDQDPIEGGDRYFIQRDLVPMDAVDSLLEPPAPPTPPQGEEGEEGDGEAEGRSMAERRAIQDRLALRDRHQDLIRQATEPVVKREADGIRSLLDKAKRSAIDGKLAELGHRRRLTDAEEMEARATAADRLFMLLDEFYDEHEKWMADKLDTALRTYAQNVAAEVARSIDGAIPEDFADFITGYVRKMSARWVGSSAGQLRQIMEAVEAEMLEEAIEERLQSWQEKRPTKTAMRESVEMGEAVTTAVFAASGVLTLMWLASGENCPLCDELNGQTVGTGRAFVEAGDTVDPRDGETTPLTSKITITHPPLHAGCDCVIVPG